LSVLLSGRAEESKVDEIRVSNRSEKKKFFGSCGSSGLDSAAAEDESNPYVEAGDERGVLTANTSKERV